MREALTSTGNGYFCIRGAAEWEDAGQVHYPGTYAHGVYNRESTIVGGRSVPNEDLVNLPCCLSLRLVIEDEDPIRLANVELLFYPRTYDVRYALVTRELRFRDRTGRETSLTSRRFVSMRRMRLGCWNGRSKPRIGRDQSRSYRSWTGAADGNGRGRAGRLLPRPLRGAG